MSWAQLRLQLTTPILMHINALDRKKTMNSFRLQNFKLDILSNFLGPLSPESLGMH